MRKHFFLLIAICGVMLTGCAQLVDLSDKESDVLAEYMAGTMLKYDANYEEALVYPEETTDEQNASDDENIIPVSSENMQIENGETQDQISGSNGVTQNLPANSQTITAVSLSELFNDFVKNNFRVAYKTYKTYDSYVDSDELFTIDASKGNKLVVFEFNIKNVASKRKKLDLLNSKISYQLVDKNNNIYYPNATLLENDIQYINFGIDAGKTKKAVLLFELPKNTDVSQMMLSLVYEDKISVVDLSK